MCSFHDPLDGVRFVIDLQKELLKVAWPAELLQRPQAASVSVPGPNGEYLIFAGLRLRAVLHTGWPTKIEVGCSWKLQWVPRHHDLLQKLLPFAREGFAGAMEAFHDCIKTSAGTRTLAYGFHADSCWPGWLLCSAVGAAYKIDCGAR